MKNFGSNEDTFWSALMQTPYLPQRQDSTEKQLEDMILVANRLGCYDAVEFMKRGIKND